MMRLLIVVNSLLLLHRAHGHGYLSTPRSRNLYASEETSWSPPFTTDDPEPENCPQCLNQGPASCGRVGDHDYDVPRNALGGLMKTNVQATYDQGDVIEVEVVLTAHHKGHFVFSGCPIMHGEVPEQECFDRHQLQFVEDLLHGANRDDNYPERAYVAPLMEDEDVGEVYYQFRMQLPPDLHGDLVLIQWYYLTANSCIHPGYLDYNWPKDWDRADPTKAGGDLCGKDSAEKFWNCAEVKIMQGKTTSQSSNNNGGQEDSPGGNKQRPGKKQKQQHVKPEKGKHKLRPGKKDKPARKKKGTRRPGKLMIVKPGAAGGEGRQKKKKIRRPRRDSGEKST